MKRKLNRIASVARTFLRSSRGNVAMLFALSFVPLMIGAGVGLDYARAMLVRQQMTEALDAAALAVGSSTGLDHDKAEDLAKRFFAANYTVDTSTFGTPVVTIPSTGYNSNGSVLITATDAMPTLLMKLVNIQSVPVAASSTVVWGQTKLWVSLVLDNSGSMSQGDSNGSKIAALRDAIANNTYGLLKTLQNAAANAGDVKVAILPFTNDVNTGTGLCSTCIDWTNWGAKGSSDSPGPSGPGDSCPYSYGCRVPGANTKTGNSWTVPTSGTTKGYICPWVKPTSSSIVDGTNGHYFMGCYTSPSYSGTTTVSTGRNASCSGYSSTNCTCTGTGRNTTCSTRTYSHGWVAETDHNLWKGCITDRTQDYDIKNTQPAGATSGMAADNNDNCPAAPTYNLSYDWTTLTTKVNAMTAAGSTNQSIGVAHGWQMLTTGDPYSTPNLPANTSKVIILFSDGLNTQDRWYGNGQTEGSTYDDSIDGRMKLVCDAAKADNVTIFAIFVHIGTNGNSAALENCASDSSKYYDLTASSQIKTAFQDIAQKITNVRVSR